MFKIGESFFSNNILARYFCNTLDEAITANQAKPFDVVVIGSGMYGAYIASKLHYWSKQQLGFEQRLRILVLEAGPYLLYEHIQNLPLNTGGIFNQVNKSHYICDVNRPEGSRYFEAVTKHSYCVGGKSLTWGKWSPRLTKKDLALWPQEVAGFLDQNYSEVEQETGVSEFSDFIYGDLFEGLWQLLDGKLSSVNHLQLMKPPVAVAVNSPASGLYSPDAYSSLSALLQSVRSESQFPDVNSSILKSTFIVPNTLAYHLQTERGRVSSIDVVYGNSYQQRSFKLSDRCDVILAGTAVESTRLALNSFPRFTQSGQELIGRNLMAHLFSAVRVRIKRKALGFPNNKPLESALYHIQGYSQNYQKSYHFQLFCNSDPEFEDHEILYKMFYDLDQIVGTVQSQVSEWITIWALSCSEIKGKPNLPLYTEGSNWMDLSPNNSEVLGSVNYPKPYLKWDSSQNEEAFWDEVLYHLFELLSSLAPFGEIEYQTPDGEWSTEKPTKFDKYQSYQSFWDSRHESGTLWMGENANQSVTDLDGKLHHIHNVYCADQALFPTVGSANPVLTGLTLDRKVAQAIINRHQDFMDKSNLNQFRSLFDGTFNGWKIQDNGEHLILFNQILELKPKGSHGVAWYELETFSEYELIVDWKVFDYDSNAGIVIHAPDPNRNSNDVYQLGYEIQIDESGYDYINKLYGSPLHKTGAIYDIAPANRGNTRKVGFWNRFRILSTRNKIEIYLNEKLVSYLSPLLTNKNTSGYICLQFHTNIIQFKNILIRQN